MDPHNKADDHRRDSGECDRRIAHQWTAAKNGQRIRHDAHRGQHDCIDPWMRKHPEHVLPQQRSPAVEHIKEVCSEPAIEPQHQERQAHGGYREQIAARSGQRAPDQHRHAINGHAGRPHAGQRRDKVCGSDRGRYAEQHHAERVDINVWARVESKSRERHIVEPARVRRLSERKARVEQNASEQEHPIRKGIEPWKRHVARAEDERPQVVREPGKHWQGIQKNHRYAVHGE
ncbi:hypothetical protein AWB74_08856 [Caballeronia arvi]|uniref:Uncharacterized protein n=1 Tax=Caballeronia arvi TaxID=1777135 RepID=A0A158L6S7_9BURK|nr:hypothetical protein AWB74_08856 [Caballeronia arvi]